MLKMRERRGIKD